MLEAASLESEPSLLARLETSSKAMNRRRGQNLLRSATELLYFEPDDITRFEPSGKIVGTLHGEMFEQTARRHRARADGLTRSHCRTARRV